MTCRRGEIVLVLFPDSNLQTAKRRPALIVQADELGAGLPQTIVAMITSNMARARRTHANRGADSDPRDADDASRWPASTGTFAHYFTERGFTRLIRITGRKGCSRQLLVNTARPGRNGFSTEA
ncbi:MAG: type II toxin-antitoxin system PemK/MazF family toxin [Bryobacteraceae bacterium]